MKKRRKVIEKKYISEVGSKLTKLELIGRGLLPIALLIMITVISIQISHLIPTSEKDINNNTYVFSEVINGHNDINLFNFTELSNNDFIILNAGNHNTKRTSFFHKKLKKCDEKNIPVGIVINSEAKNEAEIYNDVELVKSIIYYYDIDYPVYLNIDKIIENQSLTPKLKSKIIKNFLEKCTSNGIYVGIQGKDKNLCYIYNNLKITNYEMFIITENYKLISFKGKYNLYTDGENLISKKDFSEIINSQNLNISEKLVSDSRHIVSDGETISDISYKYNISVADLLEFNEIKEKDIKIGLKLRIPSRVGLTIPNIFGDYERLDSPLEGYEIVNNKSINWNHIKRDYQFVILKMSDGKNIDPSFEKSVKNSNLLGIPTGVYCSNGILKNNMTDESFTKLLEEQADFIIENLNNKKIDYPIYFSLGDNIKEKYTPDDINIILDVWIHKIISAGYEPGIYCNGNDYDYINEAIDYELNEELSVWLTDGNIKNANIMKQNDKNYSFVDYTKKINTKDWIADFPFKKFDQNSSSQQKVALISGVSLILIPSIFIRKKVHKKIKKREQ